MSQVIILSKKSRKCKHFLPVFLLFLLFCYSTRALRPHTVTATPSSFWKRSLLTYRYTASSTEYFQAVRIMYRWHSTIVIGLTEHRHERVAPDEDAERYSLTEVLNPSSFQAPSRGSAERPDNRTGALQIP